MKKAILILILTFSATTFIGQVLPKQYYDFLKKADSLYNAKDYRNSAIAYSDAFKSNGWRALPIDQYNAACLWALANYPDSAFSNLYKIATIPHFTMYPDVLNDQDLNFLHTDQRWNPLMGVLKKNKDKAESKFNKPLVLLLDSILDDDQKNRLEEDDIQKKYGYGAAEMRTLGRLIWESDSLNLIKVEVILDKYGWLGSDIVGKKGNAALFFVIQHPRPATQEKYLPLMREAVKNGNAESAHPALLEDRVAIEPGKNKYMAVK